jgi:hypothetical protein
MLDQGSYISFSCFVSTPLYLPSLSTKNDLYAVLGIFNIVLVLNVTVSFLLSQSRHFADGYILEGSTSAGLMYTVSLDANPLRLCKPRYFHSLRLQTVSHSVLSTRIMLHTGKVLRQGPANPRPPFVRHRLSTKESAGASDGSTGRRAVNEHGMDSANEVELERLINNVM